MASLLAQLLAQQCLCNRSSVNLTSKSGNLDDWTLDRWIVEWLEIGTIGLWTVGPFDYNLIQMTTLLTAVP